VAIFRSTRQFDHPRRSGAGDLTARALRSRHAHIRFRTPDRIDGGATAACHGDDDTQDGTPAATAPVPKRGAPQIPPPLDLRTPPADATKTASGLIYQRLGAGTAGARPRSEDTVLVRYTGWRQRTGETFFTTQGRAQPIAIDLAHAAPEFREALPLLRAGEKAVVWMPPRPGTLEPVAYEIELVEVLASRPAGARSSG
jgi:hypothetical protein